MESDEFGQIFHECAVNSYSVEKADLLLQGVRTAYWELMRRKAEEQ